MAKTLVPYPVPTSPTRTVTPDEAGDANLVWVVRSICWLISKKFGITATEFTDLILELNSRHPTQYFEGGRVDLIPEIYLCPTDAQIDYDCGAQFLEQKRTYHRTLLSKPGEAPYVQNRNIDLFCIEATVLRAYLPYAVRSIPRARRAEVMARVERDLKRWKKK